MIAHSAPFLSESNVNTLIQWLIAPLALAIVTVVLDRRGKRRQRQTDAKVENIPKIVSQALKRTSEELATKVDETKEAVTNNHPTHLRDDLDQQFGDLNALLEEMVERIKVVESRSLRHGRAMRTMSTLVARISKDIASLFERDEELEADADEMRKTIADLEGTIPRDKVRALVRSSSRAPRPRAGAPPDDEDEAVQ